jgi:hypothetical protein
MSVSVCLRCGVVISVGGGTTAHLPLVVVVVVVVAGWWMRTSTIQVMTACTMTWRSLVAATTFCHHSSSAGHRLHLCQLAATLTVVPCRVRLRQRPQTRVVAEGPTAAACPSFVHRSSDRGLAARLNQTPTRPMA